MVNGCKIPFEKNDANGLACFGKRRDPKEQFALKITDGPRSSFAKATDKNQKIVKSNRTIAIQVVSCLIHLLTFLRPKRTYKQQKVGKIDHTTLIKIRGRHRRQRLDQQHDEYDCKRLC